MIPITNCKYRQSVFRHFAIIAKAKATEKNSKCCTVRHELSPCCILPLPHSKVPPTKEKSGAELNPYFVVSSVFGVASQFSFITHSLHAINNWQKTVPSLLQIVNHLHYCCQLYLTQEIVRSTHIVYSNGPLWACVILQWITFCLEQKNGTTHVCLLKRAAYLLYGRCQKWSCLCRMVPGEILYGNLVERYLLHFCMWKVVTEVPTNLEIYS